MNTPVDNAWRAPIFASEVAPRAKPSNYPKLVRDLLAAALAGRTKRPLGDHFGLTNFGVNLTHLAPGAVSALRHAHLRQDEFVYVLEGTPTLHTDSGSVVVQPGMCVGFKAGDGQAHCFSNASGAPVVLLEVGDRTAGEVVTLPRQRPGSTHGRRRLDVHAQGWQALPGTFAMSDWQHCWSGDARISVPPGHRVCVRYRTDPVQVLK